MSETLPSVGALSGGHPQGWVPGDNDRDWRAVAERDVVPMVSNYHELLIDASPNSEAQSSACDLVQLAKDWEQPKSPDEWRMYMDYLGLALKSFREAVLVSAERMAQNGEDALSQEVDE